MALIGGSSERPQDSDYTTTRAWQAYLAWLEKQPLKPHEDFEPKEATSLIDGSPPPVDRPVPPERKQRPKRRQVTEAYPTGDRDLKLLARKLTGRD